ncbi:phage capsid protein [Sphingomonas sp. BK235]|uniref:phage capsid protein n=1 Tax=Sphingomonas sp. BK235 TaxID=2512131 RepID=UPI0010460DCB|nr:phage capsid protein [Sphingomonas sp. BK235]TCP35910.1 hypothetical protein EV292_102500 [Sphingomonas sp. BK235]
MADVNTTANYEFTNNVELQLQQTKSQLIDAVETQDCAGAEKVTVADLIGSTTPQEADERHGDLKETDPGHDRVWLVKTNELYFHKFVDGADQLATRISLDGGYTMAATATINLAWDDRILEGVYGPILSGKEGTTVTPFPPAQIIPAATGGAGGGATRMNVAKLRAANKMLDKAFVGAEAQATKYMVLTAEQNDDLLSEVPATSSDFKGAFGGEFQDGRIIRMLGWTFLHLELRNPALNAFKSKLTVDADGNTRTPFWVKSGVRLGIWNRLRTEIKDQPSKVNTRSVFAGTTVAATRTQAGKVGIILNSEK